MAELKPLTRERQSIWCCGVNYQRWRKLGTSTRPTDFRRHSYAICCCVCRRPLDWPAPHIWLDQTSKADRARSKVVYARRAAHNGWVRRAGKFVAQGLTTKGTPRKRRARLTEYDRRRYNRENCMRQYNRRKEALWEKGLTTKGSPRKLHRKPRHNAVEARYREFREALHVRIPDYLAFTEREAA